MTADSIFLILTMLTLVGFSIFVVLDLARDAKYRKEIHDRLDKDIARHKKYQAELKKEYDL